MTALPRDICQHWETNFDLSSVMDLLEERNFELATTSETSDRVTYVFKYQTTTKVKQENGCTNGHTDHEKMNRDLPKDLLDYVDEALFAPPMVNGNGVLRAENGINAKHGLARSLSTTSSTTSSQSRVIYFQVKLILN